MFPRKTFTLCGLCLVLGFSVPVSGDEPSAEWIWGRGARETGRHVYFKHEFKIGEYDPVVTVTRCTLHAQADFCDVMLFMNNSKLADVESGRGPVRLELLQRDRQMIWGPDGNIFAMSATATGGPAAVAVCLDLTFSNNTRMRISTGEQWQASNRDRLLWLNRLVLPEDGWTAAQTFGPVEPELWSDPERDTGITNTDDYTQWTQALAKEGAPAAPSFLTPDGFVIEQLHSARENEGSWVSLEFDPQGRLIVAREDKGLLRMTLPSGNGEIQVETINDALEECRGLLFAHDSLYVNANNSKGFFRLRDANGDGQFDETTLIYKSEGSLGHGRNDLALGPDGRIYVIHGDSVDLPQDFFNRLSPFREHSRGQKTREGYVLRFDPDGKNPELIAAGLRNPYGIAFNEDGEAFTYDADAEFDMGSPWYRPTRIDHLVSGADFGWRGVTGSWPPYFPDHPDNAQPSLDIGKGSPTGVKFGTKSNFPPKYRRSLFALDWAYGRIIAVQLTPRGAGYTGRAEVFLKGRPLNVTDLDFGPDGAMYFVTGGRKTQAGLFRVRYVGPLQEVAPPTPQQQARSEYSRTARAKRRELEQFHGRQDLRAIDAAWPYLDSGDVALRYAARIAIEHQPLEQWQARALEEKRPRASATAMMALARSDRPELRNSILERLLALPLKDFPLDSRPQETVPADVRATALHTYAICLPDVERLDSKLRIQISNQFYNPTPRHSAAIIGEQLRLGIALRYAAVLPQVMERLLVSTDQRERMLYLYLLRNASQGWTPPLRKQYFQSLLQMRAFQGGEGMPKFTKQIEADALAAVPEGEREKYAAILAVKPDEEPPPEPRPLVKEWTLEELMPLVLRSADKPSFQRGQEMFTAALCIRCHRMGHLGAAIGPDLTSVGSRFSSPDILRSIVQPSDVVAEQYRRAQIVTTDGKVLVGQVIPSTDFRSPNLLISTDPLRPNVLTEVPKSEIESHTTSPVSVMPKGLLNTLTQEEIVDLLVWLQFGGNPNAQPYQKRRLE